MNLENMLQCVDKLKTNLKTKPKKMLIVYTLVGMSLLGCGGGGGGGGSSGGGETPESKSSQNENVEIIGTLPLDFGIYENGEISKSTIIYTTGANSGEYSLKNSSSDIIATRELKYNEGQFNIPLEYFEKTCVGCPSGKYNIDLILKNSSEEYNVFQNAGKLEIKGLEEITSSE